MLIFTFLHAGKVTGISMINSHLSSTEATNEIFTMQGHIDFYHFAGMVITQSMILVILISLTSTY